MSPAIRAITADGAFADPVPVRGGSSHWFLVLFFAIVVLASAPVLGHGFPAQDRTGTLLGTENPVAGAPDEAGWDGGKDGHPGPPPGMDQPADEADPEKKIGKVLDLSGPPRGRYPRSDASPGLRRLLLEAETHRGGTPNPQLLQRPPPTG